jgi:ABC-type Fe3+/spermidine/putrescine transport system ATPase subunit
MPGAVTAAGEEGAVRLDSGVEVRTATDGLSVGDRCHAVVRPEKLRIDSKESRPPDGWPHVDGLVESSVYLGTSTQIVVKLPGDVSMTVLSPNASEAERSRLPGGGAPVTLSWAPEHVHLIHESSNGAAAEPRDQPSSTSA